MRACAGCDDTFDTFDTKFQNIALKTNKFILCFASIVFIPPPFHISPVSRGRATFLDKFFTLEKINTFLFLLA